MPILPPPTAGYVIVKAGIEGADVLINGSQSSQTAAGGIVRLPLVPGQYTVEVRKKGYVSSKPLNVVVSKGKDIAAEFNLRPLPTAARLLIAGAAPNLQVFADGHYLGLTGSDGSFSQSVDAGDHDISVEKDGGRSNTIRKTFVAGQPLNLDGKQFVIAAPRPSMASIAVRNLPPGATVKVEGTTYRADASGGARFEVLPGTHTLEFTADGYKPKQVQRSFTSGESPIDASLERIDTEGLDVFEAAQGYVPALYDDGFKAEEMLGYGRAPFRVVDPGYAIKMFPSQFGTHFGITAGLELHPHIAVACCDPPRGPDRAGYDLRQPAAAQDRSGGQVLAAIHCGQRAARRQGRHPHLHGCAARQARHAGFARQVRGRSRPGNSRPFRGDACAAARRA